MAAALIDRLLHHCHIVNIRRQQLPDAPSYRALQSAPLASCGVELFTPSQEEENIKGDDDDLEARHLPPMCDIFNRR